MKLTDKIKSCSSSKSNIQIQSINRVKKVKNHQKEILSFTPLTSLGYQGWRLTFR